MAKNNKVLIITVLTLGSIFLLNTSILAVNGDYTVDTENQCIISTDTLSITSQPGDIYSVSEFRVSTEVCLKVIFHNADTTDHTFTINNNDKSESFNYFNIYLEPGQTNSSTFLVPDYSTTIQYYCDVPGHKSVGEVGQLIVGDSSAVVSGPNYYTLIFYILMAILIIFSIVIYVRAKLERPNELKRMDTYIHHPSNPKKLVCSNCSTILDPNDIYCQNCGRRI